MVKMVEMFDLKGRWMKGVKGFVGGNGMLLIGKKGDIVGK